MTAVEERVQDEDRRDVSSDEYDPRAALAECYDLWASGAWPDENAPHNLGEVMEHLANLLNRA